jgi:hypothetical protein
LPGGFAATVQVPAANAGVLNGVAPDAGTFVTAGFAQFNVTDSQGNAIKTFDKPLTLGIDMPKGTLGADGNPVTAGDSYPVWSYDDANGNWNFEKMGTVAEKTPVDPANFTVQFQTNHLSTWALNTYLPSCPMAATLQGRPVNGHGRHDAGGTAGQPAVLRRADRRARHAARAALRQGPDRNLGGLRRRNPATPGAYRLPVDFNIVALGISNGVFSYTRKLPTSADNFASSTVVNVSAGAVIVKALDPRTGRYIATTDITRSGAASPSGVADGETTFFRFHFPMTCKTVSGGF